DLATRELVHTFLGHDGAVVRVLFTADGKQALSASSDGTVRSWDVATGKELRVVRVGQPLETSTRAATATCLDLSPDGKRALVGYADDLVALWDLKTGRQLWQTREHRGQVVALACSRNGQAVLSGSYDGKLLLWNPADGTPVRALNGHTAAVTGAALS